MGKNQVAPRRNKKIPLLSTKKDQKTGAKRKLNIFLVTFKSFLLVDSATEVSSRYSPNLIALIWVSLFFSALHIFSASML